MSKIKIELAGLGSLIEDIRATKAHCHCTECINHVGWRGRKSLSLANRCTLDNICLNSEGACEEHQIEPRETE